MVLKLQQYNQLADKYVQPVWIGHAELSAG